MQTYLARVRGFSADIKLFLVYNLLANIGFGVLELVFNFYLLELGYREDFIGEWRSLQTISMAVTAASVGFFINRYGPWRAIVGGFSLLSGASFAVGLAEAQFVLLGLAIVYGVGLAFLFNPLMPFIMEFARADQRQHASAVMMSIVSLSVTFGSLIGGFAPSLYGQFVPSISEGSVNAYRAAILTGAFIATLGLIPLFLMKGARQAGGLNHHKGGIEQETHTARRQVRRDIGIFIVVGGLMSIGVGMVQPFYNVFLKSLGASDSQVGYIFAIGGLTAAVIGLGAPAMANRFGSINAVLLLRLTVVPFYLALIFAPNLGMAVLAYLSRQVSISMAWPIDSTFIGEVLPPRARSGVFGLRSSAWNAGFAFATFAAGRIIVERGYSLTFFSLVFFSALSAIVFYSYYSRHPKVTAGEIPSAMSRARRATMAVPVPGAEDVAQSDGARSSTA